MDRPNYLKLENYIYTDYVEVVWFCYVSQMTISL